MFLSHVAAMFLTLRDQAQVSERLDTAHRLWDVCWKSEDGRADWLEPHADVLACIDWVWERHARKALDLGCGVGQHALAMAARGLETCALDASEAGLAHLGEVAERSDLKIACQQGEMTALPYGDRSFDFVLSFNVIYHGDRSIVERAISEIARVLKPGGIYQGTMLSKRSKDFGKGREVAPDTYVDEADDITDKAHPHYYCSGSELAALFYEFELWSLRDVAHRRGRDWHWYMIAERK